MADMVKYVRIAPYNKRKGHLVQRYVIGGRLFVAGRWYRMPLLWAQRLSKLEQPTGAPIFDVMNEQQYKETTRREMAAAMTAAGFEGLTSGDFANIPKPSTPKSGARESQYADLEKVEVDEIDLSKKAVEAPVEKAVESAKDEEGEDKLDLDSMQRADLVALADNWGVPLPEGADAAQIRGLLAEYL